MNLNFLDFEQPIAELEAKIEELKLVGSEGLSRHPQRPYTLDYIQRMFDYFHELHGDRMFGDDHAIVGGLARLGARSVVVLGHQKGRDTNEKVFRNFGMPRPEGYRKALRLMRMAEKFCMPIVALIDTPGAYPGVGAEERGQSEAIARNLFVMAELSIPVVAVVIGEGGSGGALAIGVSDRLLMLEFATYSVISPEGCASILWKSADKAADAAEAMGMTSKKLHQLGLIDEIISEPLGGAHRNPEAISEILKSAVVRNLDILCSKPVEELLEERQSRLMQYGNYTTG